MELFLSLVLVMQLSDTDRHVPAWLLKTYGKRLKLNTERLSLKLLGCEASSRF